MGLWAPLGGRYTFSSRLEEMLSASDCFSLIYRERSHHRSQVTM